MCKRCEGFNLLHTMGTFENKIALISIRVVMETRPLGMLVITQHYKIQELFIFFLGEGMATVSVG